MVAEFTPSFSAHESNLPPQNIEAEESILGGILLDPGAIERVIEILDPDAFSVSDHRTIYKALVTLHKQNKSVDLMTATAYLSDRKLLEKVGGMNKLAQLVDRTVSARNIDKYAELLTEKHLRRKVINFGHELVRLGYESMGDTFSLFKWASETLTELSFLSPCQQDDLSTIKYNRCIEAVRAIELAVTDPGLKAWKMKELAARFDCTPKQLETIYYCSLLQEDDEPMMDWKNLKEAHGETIRQWLLHGLLPLDSTILLHGDGGMGKSRLAYDWLYHIANGIDWHGFPVQQAKCLVIQTDESPSDMLQVLEDRGLADNPWVRYKTRWVIEFIQQLDKEIEEFKPKYIFIDSLTTINKRSLFSENDVEYARPILLLRDLAQKHNCCIVIIHHSNKEGNSRGTTAIRNSVSASYRIKPDNSSSSDSTYRQLEIEKCRFRIPGAYQLRFESEDSSFTCVGKVGEESVSTKATTKTSIIEFLAQTPGTFYQVEEIHAHTGGSFDHVRRCCYELALDGMVVRKGKKPSLYAVNFGKANDRPSDHPIPMIKRRSDEMIRPDSPTDKPFEPSDHLIIENANFSARDREKNSKSDDQMIRRDEKSSKVSPIKASVSDHPSDRNDQTSDRTDSNDQSAIAELQIPTDGLGHVLAVGDRVRDLAEEQSIGTIKSIQTQKRGSPKEPFFAWKIYVVWDDDDMETWEEPSFLHKITPSKPEPTLLRPKEWKVGDRAQCNGRSLTITEIRGSIHVVDYDSGLTALLGHCDLEPLPPEQDPRIKSAHLAESLSTGDKLKALKHLDHKGFANRNGTINKIGQHGSKHIAYCTLSNGEKAIFNLEAVEVLK